MTSISRSGRSNTCLFSTPVCIAEVNPGLAAPADIRLMRLDPIGDHGLSERFALWPFLPAARLSRAPAKATLAGNLTVLGSIANLIVVQTAEETGVKISFWD